MFKLISILIINGIVLLILISCHNKTNNSRNAINLEYENSTDSLNSHKMDASHFINSIEPGETIVEEKQMQGKELIKRINEKIKVSLLLQDPCSKDGFLKTEITNNTNDTIYYINNIFSYYKESDDSWLPLVYPNNYVKNDIGYSIPSQKSIQIKFFLPPQEEYPKGKYKLQLLFRSTLKDTYYYIDKFFLSTTLK
ncbi:immunoglobulin-like domain-containing protein [Bacteroides sp.]|uniref:immunoglobulin-like domain-containing protein n=1 Tax=Bacteroides sp. TaxID=29523 RepID=UPI0025BF2EE2|nr:immunoglobulin-like domain-containing protein [Bacteroides sp.]